MTQKVTKIALFYVFFDLKVTKIDQNLAQKCVQKGPKMRNYRQKNTVRRPKNVIFSDFTFRQFSQKFPKSLKNMKKAQKTRKMTKKRPKMTKKWLKSDQISYSKMKLIRPKRASSTSQKEVQIEVKFHTASENAQIHTKMTKSAKKRQKTLFLVTFEAF
jgi:hypothetical protein